MAKLKHLYQAHASIFVIVALIICSPFKAVADTPLSSMRFTSGPRLTPSDAASYYNTLSDTATYNVNGTRAPEIVAQASALENNPRKIYNFVRNNIEFEARYGTQKGAVGALIDRSGTAFDQAQLLVELLRQAGYPSARYVVGTLTLSGTQFQSWVGITDPETARSYLADSGIPATVNGTTTISSVEMGHAWVQVEVSGVSYTLDPSYKEHDFWTPIDIASLASYSSNAFVAMATTTSGQGTENGVPYITGVDIAGIENELKDSSLRLLTSLKASYASKSTKEVIGGRKIIFQDDPWSLTQAGTKSVSIGTFTGGLPDKFRTKLGVQVGACNVSFFIDDIYGRRLVVNGDKVHETTAFDNATISGKGLLLDDNVINSICASSTSAQELILSLNLPYAANAGTYMDRVSTKLFDKDSDFAIVFGFGDVSPNLVGVLSTRTNDATNRIAQRLNSPNNFSLAAMNENVTWYGPPSLPLANMEEGEKVQLGAVWMAQLVQSAHLIEAITGSKVAHHYSIGIVYSQFHRTVRDINNNGVDDGEPVIIGSGIDKTSRIDVDSGFTITAPNLSPNDLFGVKETIAAVGAALEGSIFEQREDAVETMSTAQRFPWAQENYSQTIRYHNFSAQSGINILERRAGNNAISNHCDAGRILALSGYNVIAANDQFLGPGTDSIPDADVQYFLSYPATSIQVDQRAPQFDVTMHRGCAWLAIKNDGSEISHVVTSLDKSFKGGGSSTSATNASRFINNQQGDLLKSKFVDKSNISGVDLRTGDLSLPIGAGINLGLVGSERELNFQRYYSRSTEGCPGCMFGWTHSFDIRASFSGAGLEAMGASTPLATPATLVAFKASYDLLRTNPLGTANNVAALAVMRWWTRNLTYNVATVRMGPTGKQFIKLIDGSFFNPAAPAEALLQQGERYHNRVVGDGVAATHTNSFGTSTYWTEYDNRQELWKYDQITLTYNNGHGQTIKFSPRKYNPFTYMEGGICKTLAYLPRAEGFFANELKSPSGATIKFEYNEGYSIGGSSMVVQINSVTYASYDTMGSDLASSLGLSPVNSITGFHGFVDTPFGFPNCTDRLAKVYNDTGQYILFNGLNVTTSDGRTSNVTVSSGLKTVLSEPRSGLVTQIINSDNSIINLAWDYTVLTDRPDRLPRLKSITKPGATTPTISFTYDALGRVVTTNDAIGNLTSDMSRNSYYFPAGYGYGAYKNALGVAVRLAYNVDNLPVSQTDELERKTTSIYDSLGRIISRIYPESNKELFEYDSKNNVIKLTKVPKPSSSLSNIVVLATYDPLWNNLATITDPKGYVTSYDYGATAGSSGQLIRVIQPDPVTGATRMGPVTSFSYDTMGRLQTITDPRGYVTSNIYDALGFLATTIFDPSGLNIATNYTYDSYGNNTIIDGPRTDVDDKVYSTYDILRRKIFEISADPDGAESMKRSIVKHIYDADGLETLTQIGTGIAIDGSDFTVSSFKRMTYDAVGQLIKTEIGQP